MNHQIDMFDDGTRDFLKELREDWKIKIQGNGAVCPCCDRKGKVNMFRFTQTWAITLKWMFDHQGDDGWVNVQRGAPRIVLRGKNYSMIANWGLIESQTNRSGVWRLTQEGKDFVQGYTRIPIKLFTYNNSAWGFSSEETSFRGCFGKHFDFDEMMSFQFKWENLKVKKQ